MSRRRWRFRQVCMRAAFLPPAFNWSSSNNAFPEINWRKKRRRWEPYSSALFQSGMQTELGLPIERTTNFWSNDIKCLPPTDYHQHILHQLQLRVVSAIYPSLPPSLPPLCLSLYSATKPHLSHRICTNKVCLVAYYGIAWILR